MNSKVTHFKSNVIFLVILLFTLITSGISAQLVTNGGFESSEVDTVSDMDVEGWLIAIASGANAIFEIVDDTVQQGEKALKITVSAIGGNAWDIQVVADSIPVQQGETYRYSVWAKSSESSQINFTVGNYAYTEYSGVIRPSCPNVTTEWQEYTFTFTVNDAVTYIRAPIHLSIAANVGAIIYIDNLQIIDVEQELASRNPIIVETESGIIGSEFDSLQTEDGSIQYISISTDYNQTTGASDHPGENRTVSYEIKFPDTGTYDLFARLRVGAAGYNDDSFFYGNGFGGKNAETPADWIMVNGLQEAGFTSPNAVVREQGGLGNGMWKWVNLSRNGFQSGNFLQFSVDFPDSLTKIFVIGARENGFDLDKFVFGRSELYFTVTNLDSGQAGSETDPNELPEELDPIALGKDKFLGNVYSTSQLPRYTEFWNQVTPENAGKWASVEGTRNNMNWGALDAAYALAKDNGFPFRYHVLIWGNQQPGWIESLPSNEQLEEIEEWFAAVAERYPDIDYLEVVNEPLHDPPDGPGDGNYIDALGGSNDLYGTGWDWIIKAFELAIEYFPDSTKLMINDYNIVNSDANTTNYLNIINLLMERELIDGIGVQGHAFSTRGSMTTITNNLNRLAETGLPIQVCELDIDGSSDQVQLEDYQEIIPKFWENPAVEGITLWGWRPGMWRTDEMAFLVSNDGTERPALVWLRDYIQSTILVSVENPVFEIPQAFYLSNNYPNPFNPTTTISYQLPVTSHLIIKVYNLLGKEVATLFEGVQLAGDYVASFDGSGLAGGVYLYQMKARQINARQANNFVETKKFVLLK
ncbi:MAG: endo-1,4-beta-xylanase [Candidatus Marinimicrobia bacterium]|nr:endo-1,4-beta-xylanase [Candidatus Neomarinimicrobiota bacterium]